MKHKNLALVVADLSHEGLIEGSGGEWGGELGGSWLEIQSLSLSKLALLKPARFMQHVHQWYLPPFIFQHNKNCVKVSKPPFGRHTPSETLLGTPLLLVPHGIIWWPPWSVDMEILLIFTDLT